MTELHPPSPDDSRPNESESSKELSVWDYLIHLPGEYYQRLISRKPVVAVRQDFEKTKSQGVLQEIEGIKESTPSSYPVEGEIISNTSTSPKVASAIPTSTYEGGSPDLPQQRVFSIRLPFGFSVNVIKEPKQKNDDQESTVAGSRALQQTKPKHPIKFSAKRIIKPHEIACSLILSIAGLWLLFQTVPGLLWWLAWVLLFNGLLIYLFATRVGEDGKVSLWDHLTGGRLDFGIKGWQKICLAVSVCLAVMVAATAGSSPLMPNPYLTTLAWLGAIILAIIGGWKNTVSPQRLNKWDVILFLVFTFTAFVIRFVNIAGNPNVLTGDEASSGLSAVEFVQGRMNNIFTIGWYSFPSFFNFLQSLSIRLLGQTTAALRVPSVLAGAITVGAVYLFGRQIFNRWTGVFAALFLLAFHYHNHFSRIGLNNIWDGLWFTAVLGLVWYGWEKEDRLSFLFGGLFLGLSQYFYVSSRALLGLVPLSLLILALVDRKGAGKRLADILLMMLVFLVVIMPLLFYYLRYPLEYNAPMQRFSIFSNWMGLRMEQTGWSPPRIVLDQIGLSAEGLINRPLNGPWYEPMTPLLRPISAFLFLMGLLALSLKWRSRRTFILILWVGVIVLVGALSENTPAAQRYIAIAPAIALTIGFGLAELGRLLGKIRPVYTNWILVALLTTMIVFGVDELRFYYYNYAPQAELGGDNGLVVQKLADYLQTKDSSWQVAFFGFPRMGYFSYSTLPYLAPQITGVDMNAPWGSPENPALASEHMIFVFLPEHLEDLKAVQADYPNGSLHEEKYKDRTLYWMYEVLSP